MSKEALVLLALGCFLTTAALVIRAVTPAFVVAMLGVIATVWGLLKLVGWVP